MSSLIGQRSAACIVGKMFLSPSVTAGPRRQPTLLVTGPDRGGAAMWLFSRRCLTAAGGKAVRATPACPFCEPFDGLVLGGGSDINAELYDQPLLELRSELRSGRHGPTLAEQLLSLAISFCRWLLRRDVLPHHDPERDTLELQYLHYALREQLPVLGICRGMQLLNVAFGGSLHQDLSGFYVETPEVRTIFPRRLVLVEAESRLRQILARDRLRVNSLHRQGIAELASGLAVNALDLNGIIQGIEAPERRFVLGVQWHPEFLLHERRLFECLVIEAKAVMNRKNRQPPVFEPPPHPFRFSPQQLPVR